MPRGSDHSLLFCLQIFNWKDFFAENIKQQSFLEEEILPGKQLMVARNHICTYNVDSVCYSKSTVF